MNKKQLVIKIDKVISDYKEADLKAKYHDLSDLHNDALVKSLKVRALHLLEAATTKDDVFRKQAYRQDGRSVGLFELIGMLEALKNEVGEDGKIDNEVEAEKEYNILKEDFISDSPPLKSDKKHKCFVIMPIGEKGTIEYKNNLSVYNDIIKPCTENSGYNIECYHADLIKKSGDISKQVIEALRDDDIVIADLRRGNSNVIYELGIRHTFGKRSILVCSSQTEHFFHTTKYRAIPYRVDGKSNQDFRERLTSYIDDIIKNPKKSDNPVTDTIGVSFYKTTDSINKKILEETRITQCTEKYKTTGGGDFLIKTIETYDDLTKEEKANILDKALIRGRGRKAKNNPFR